MRLPLIIVSQIPGNERVPKKYMDDLISNFLAQNGSGHFVLTPTVFQYYTGCIKKSIGV